MIQASLNGPFTKDDHPALPITGAELAASAAECAAAGARSFHVHPRTEAGVETLAADVIDTVVAAVKSSQPYPVGVGTGAWIEGSIARRLANVSGWKVPDFASVNVAEEGAFEVMRRLSILGIDIEAGVWTVDDAEVLVRSDVVGSLARILVEPVELDTPKALEIVGTIHEILDRGGVEVPRLQHGDGEATWVLLEDAVRRGIDVRVGFEDTFTLPDGSMAYTNADLVRAAMGIAGGARK
ncbi:3-keto-5-aminohexanoate cleavage protein [Subtercola boreus]|uniref:3-keto-5-aminohexanoate cleavage protein n=1 Tax=Subtercola boreus TaxID=120213 RepID=A0A3E0WBS1_9MICO|nr:3-keto-5-aminohexanoate cleavage protein [Subtercola boreus]RFA22009.1 hypothetical protein B7R24_04795 [Subtercola boreus]RFA22189.1 hypothetical protein B7R23_04740 [Subtercola boreus]RFA28051.1 hypothetical protein B7R25_04865 [Subtercola boreus]